MYSLPILGVGLTVFFVSKLKFLNGIIETFELTRIPLVAFSSKCRERESKCQLREGNGQLNKRVEPAF